MEQLINLKTYPVKDVLDLLLVDKTTKKNITFATDSYEKFGSMYKKENYITKSILLGLNELEIQPRIFKDLEEQISRTRKTAEVFTPAWVCNKMNNYCDSEWFGYPDVFNTILEETWNTNLEKINFPKDKSWKMYIDSKRLEIACGEAPYIVSRYDVSSGEFISIKDRIGILDRKLRIVNENTSTEEDWLKYVIKSFQSVYGYDYQGDNLLIARINLLMTFVEYMEDRWHKSPNIAQLKKISNIIAWNFWQMDGLKGCVPFSGISEVVEQISFFNINPDIRTINKEIFCRIYDWKANKSILFNDLMKER